jgi:MarR family transcriptional regulator, organic hydroperoxide resistance regulator
MKASPRTASPKNPPKKRARAASPRSDNGAGEPEERDEALGATLDFMRLLWAVDHGLQRRSKRMETELGVTGVQRMVIRLIGRFPGIAAGRLAELLHVHPSTLTGVLKRLVDRNLALRDRDPDDARRSRFRLTREGARVDATQAGTVEAAVRRALARLSAAQLDASREVLSAVGDELGRSDR